MRLKGRVSTGVLRGSAMINIFYPRLVHILRFEPFKGTLNVVLEEEVDIKDYSTKKISHILLDGSEHIDAYLALIKFYYRNNVEECWTMWQTTNIYGKKTIEVVSKENLREKFGINENDSVEIEFMQMVKKPRNIPGMKLIAKLYGRESHLTKS